MKLAHTVRKTLPISAPTSACRQPDSVHKRKIPFPFVLFTQRIFAFVLSFSPSVNFLLSFTSSGKLKTICLVLVSFSHPSVSDSTPLPTSPFRIIFSLRFKQCKIKKSFCKTRKVSITYNIFRKVMFQNLIPLEVMINYFFVLKVMIYIIFVPKSKD